MSRLLFYKAFLLLIITVASCSKGNPEVKPEPPKPEEPEKKKEYFDASYKVPMANPLQDKIFPFFSLLKLKSESLVKDNTVFKSLSQKYRLRLENVVGSYKDEGAAVFQQLLFKPEEISDVKKELLELTRQGKLQALIDHDLKSSGLFRQYAEMSNEAMLGFVWEDAAHGTNLIIENYLLGKEMSDKDKNGPLYEHDDAKYQQSVINAIQQILTETESKQVLFYENPLSVALQILQLNGRNEAARYEPLITGENKLALQAIAGTDFSKYTYTALIVLGDSPNSAGDELHLSESAKARVAMGVEKYRSAVAAFIVFTGANVYPNHTAYHEAIEMKKYAMTKFSVPEHAILVDPHARHTTTNLRNISRLIFRYKIPSDKKALVVATTSHINTMISSNFRSRCIREIGYDPIPANPTYNANELEIIPDIKALQINPKDFLDP